jgi:hypothetical protein
MKCAGHTFGPWVVGVISGIPVPIVFGLPQVPDLHRPKHGFGLGSWKHERIAPPAIVPTSWLIVHPEFQKVAGKKADNLIQAYYPDAAKPAAFESVERDD